MSRFLKEPKEKVSIRIEESVREKLLRLARADRRDEADYWRKVLAEHVESAERRGELPEEKQLSLGSAIDVEVATKGGAS